MAKLTCLSSVSQWELEQTTKYPELEAYVNKLKNNIRENPDKGLCDPVLSVKGKTLECRKQSVNITLFSRQYAIGYSFVTAHYLHNEDDIAIIKMNYS